MRLIRQSKSHRRQLSLQSLWRRLWPRSNLTLIQGFELVGMPIAYFAEPVGEYLDRASAG
jgi:hypothetical protein